VSKETLMASHASVWMARSFRKGYV